MSYNIHLEMKDGNLSVHSVTGDVPEGKFNVAGHEDDSAHSISVTRYNQRGETVVQATSHGKKA
jgi:hypothetical protein